MKNPPARLKVTDPRLLGYQSDLLMRLDFLTRLQDWINKLPYGEISIVAEEAINNCDPEHKEAAKWFSQICYELGVFWEGDGNE